MSSRDKNEDSERHYERQDRSDTDEGGRNGDENGNDHASRTSEWTRKGKSEDLIEILEVIAPSMLRVSVKARESKAHGSVPQGAYSLHVGRRNVAGVFIYFYFIRLDLYRAHLDQRCTLGGGTAD